MLKKIKSFPGEPYPLGFSIKGNKANIALFSSRAEKAVLALFNGMETREIALNKSGDIWHIGLENLPPKTEYAFKVKGPYAPEEGLLYKENIYLADPYSKAPSTSFKWGEGTGSVKSACVSADPFDWQGVTSPRIAKKDLIIYEIHVRGFTQHASSLTTHPGTFSAIIEKIPYFKKLGINALELMPIFEFDEAHRKGKPNYWGYSPLYFFAPMKRFSSENPVVEFKTLVRELHRNGIEMLLDVVYNHTGESKDLGYYVNFRGIDNTSYYMIGPGGRYLDFSGCFNTFNVNHKAAASLILDSLRYWVLEMGVDGFRFDLASIFNRDCHGKPIDSSPILNAITSDPIFENTKLIAEPWDAAGLYQPGVFAKLGKWAEWNGLFRDHVRQFIKGTDSSAGPFAKVLTGSQFIYSSTSPLSSVNFVTAHDGFTLRDLVSYQQKKNFDNEEMNKDGNDHNLSWNCGAEGETEDKSIQTLRERQMRNFLLSLFLAQGIPMLKMGDEYGHTSKGNNNPYVQDNEISWFLWDELEKNRPMFEFVSSLILFRKNHADLFHERFLTDREIEWHGTDPFNPDWSGSSRFISFTLKGISPLYVAFNADHAAKKVDLPQFTKWKKVVKTEECWSEHNLNCPEKGLLISSIELIPYSALVAKGSSLKENPLIC